MTKTTEGVNFIMEGRMQTKKYNAFMVSCILDIASGLPIKFQIYSELIFLFLKPKHKHGYSIESSLTWFF